MPDPAKVLILGPGPAQIGEGGELDGAALEGARALREDGFEVVLVTSSAATVCSAPAAANRTYIEPLDVPTVRAIVDAERPAVVLPLFGAATLGLALDEALAVAGGEVGERPILGGASASALRAIASTDPEARRAAIAGETFATFEVVLLREPNRGDDGAARVIGVVESLGAPGAHPADVVCVTPPIAAMDTEIERAIRAAIDAVQPLELASVVTVEVAVRRGTDATETRAIAITPGASRTTAFVEASTGFPVARAIASLSVGRPARAEAHAARPFVRAPRFALDAFPAASAAPGPARKSVGEIIVPLEHADHLREHDAPFAAALGAAGSPLEARIRDAAARASTTPGAQAPERAARSVLVLGPGPTGIGHGPELAVSVAAALEAAASLGYEPVLLDASPEGLAVAAPSARRVHVGPLTVERVLDVYAREAAVGVIAQFGGEGALRLADDLAARGVRVLGGARGEPSARRTLAEPISLRSPGTPPPVRAVGLEVVAVADGTRAVIAGVVEHLEPPYVHRGDAAAILPCFTVPPDLVAAAEAAVRERAVRDGVIGVLAVYAIVTGTDVEIVEAAPRATAIVPFVSRATAFPVVEIATKVLLGKTLDELGVNDAWLPRFAAARERVFPYARLGVEMALGSEMHSIGESSGFAETPARAYGKALRGIGFDLHAPGHAKEASGRAVVLDMAERDRSASVELGRRLRSLGFDLLVIGELRAALRSARVAFVDLGDEDPAPAVAAIADGRAAFAVVTSEGDTERPHARAIRAACLTTRAPCFSTAALARLACAALEAHGESTSVDPPVALQDLYATTA